MPRLPRKHRLLLPVGLLTGLLALQSPLLAAPPTEAVALDAERQIGAVREFGRLSMAPIVSRTDGQAGPFTSLDRALASGGAVVQEIGADRPPGEGPDEQVMRRNVAPNVAPPVRPSRAPQAPNPVQQSTIRPEPNQMPEIQQQIGPGGSARVNTLEIINKGGLPILVLAGTIVKGGKQDRQIGQDFVIEPGKKVPVDAFCVEKGRWTGTRQGKDTAGKFETSQILANQAVRAAGQYERNQSKVWEKVSETNRAAGAETESDTLSATLDSERIVKARTALAGQIRSYLDGLPQKHRLVGLSYGIDGRPRSVRWFASPALFGFFRETLIQTAAFDAVTTPQSAAGVDVSTQKLTQNGILAFVNGIRGSATSERRKTAAGNVNLVWQGEYGYGSQTLVLRNGKEQAITADFLAK